MKLSLLPPLVVLCSELLLQKPSSVAFPNLQSNHHYSVQAVQEEISAGRPVNLIFHPSTNSCVLRTLPQNNPLKLGPCGQSDAWAYTPQKYLLVKGTYFCLQAVDSGRPAKLGIICTESDSQWELTSNSKSNLSTKLAGGRSLCLDVDSDNLLITNPCAGSGLGESDSQWFKIVSGRRDNLTGNQLEIP